MIAGCQLWAYVRSITMNETNIFPDSTYLWLKTSCTSSALGSLFMFIKLFTEFKSKISSILSRGPVGLEPSTKRLRVRCFSPTSRLCFYQALNSPRCICKALIVPFLQVPNHRKTLRILCFFQPEGSQLFEQLRLAQSTNYPEIHKRTILNSTILDIFMSYQ